MLKKNPQPKVRLDKSVKRPPKQQQQQRGNAPVLSRRPPRQPGR